MFEGEGYQLKILYQDGHLVAIDKPSGLLVHRTALARKEKWFAMQMLRDQLGQHVYPIHRLDRPTSGILVFALSSDCARRMGEQLSNHDVEKCYLALVRGWIQKAGILDYPLKEELDRTTDKMASQDKEPQQALTHYHPKMNIELPVAAGRYSSARYSWMVLKPKTGRKHQLRRHMAHLRHPIIGDTTHGDGRQNRAFASYSGVARLMLHACSMAFTHPYSENRISIDAALPNEWVSMASCPEWPGRVPYPNVDLI